MRYGYLLGACLAAQFLSAPAAVHGSDSVPATANISGVDPAFVGHYYLSGVMETGSELLLREDGSFEWYISYGAMDQFAQGTWRRAGESIVLAARQPSKDKPLFAYLDTQPWSAEAEQSRLDREHDAKVDAVRAACPFLADMVSTTSPAPTNDDRHEESQPSPEDLRRKAETALAAAREARSWMEVAARRIMAGASIDAAAVSEAHRVTAAWYEANDTARSAADAAGLSTPDLADPVLPPACKMPERQTADPGAPESWERGLAVQVVEPKSGRNASDVKISLRSGDGKMAEANTSREGIAFLPDFGSATAFIARLSAPYAPGREVDIKIPAVHYGIIRFSIDIDHLSVPPFEQLILKIDGTALLPEAFGRGRYTR